MDSAPLSLPMPRTRTMIRVSAAMLNTSINIVAVIHDIAATNNTGPT